MAIRYSSPHMAISGGNFNKKPEIRVPMLHNSPLPLNRTSNALIRSSSFNKVFEDQSRGIVCYRDDRGEVICEGYDEGPRFHPPALQKVYHKSLPAYSQILDFLQASRLLESVTEKGVAIRED